MYSVTIIARRPGQGRGEADLVYGGARAADQGPQEHMPTLEEVRTVFRVRLWSWALSIPGSFRDLRHRDRVRMAQQMGQIPL